jgi:hypothetical protein
MAGLIRRRSRSYHVLEGLLPPDRPAWAAEYSQNCPGKPASQGEIRSLPFSGCALLPGVIVHGSAVERVAQYRMRAVYSLPGV